MHGWLRPRTGGTAGTACLIALRCLCALPPLSSAPFCSSWPKKLAGMWLHRITRAIVLVFLNSLHVQAAREVQIR